MEFTENQQHPLKRMSRLGVVALLHVALLAALLNSMKIKITPPVFFEPKSIHEPEKPKPVEQVLPPVPPDTLPPPINPPITPPTIGPGDPPPINPPPAGGNTGDIGPSTLPPGGTGVTGGGTETGSPPARKTVHIAAIVDMSRCEKPAYPARSIRLGETGTVTLAMLIGTDGRVLETKTEGSSGSRDLDKAASQALSLCRFTPGTIDGVAQQSWTKVQYVWNLD